MVQPHYHRCTGDCPDGLTAATIERRESVHSFADLLFRDGTHRYWSTHCRHGNHHLCSATFIAGQREGQPAYIDRKPAQCKDPNCQAPCLCSCHTKELSEESAA
jgi:hypothetical protein